MSAEALYTVLVAIDSGARLRRMVVAPMPGQPGEPSKPVGAAKAVLAPAAAATGHLLQRLQQPGQTLPCQPSMMSMC